MMNQEQSVDRTKHPLYHVLLEIGSKEKSIAPTRLAKYKALLDSREVLRRAKMTTDTNQLAQHARQAILTIVNDTPDETRKLVLQAALATTKAYRGLRVGQREEILEELPKPITKDMFRYHRRKGFETIIDILESGAEPFTTQNPPTGRQWDHPEHFVLPMVRVAANLHYAMLASLFIASFEPNAGALGVSVGVRRSEERNMCMRRAFESFSEFLLIFRANLDTPSARESLMHYLPKQSIDSLRRLLQSIIDRGPRFATTRDRMLFEWHLYEGLETDRFFTEIWEPWFHGGVQRKHPASQDLLPSIPMLEPIAVNAGAAVSILTDHVILQEPAISEARGMAYKIISYSYNCDEFAPIFNGRSLRYHAEAYLDTKT
ncbi:MAG: hypothetical protein WBQ21_13440 [Solirubrobacteraceae bacterium]